MNERKANFYLTFIICELGGVQGSRRFDDSSPRDLLGGLADARLSQSLVSSFWILTTAQVPLSVH
jgi:hypothetical protein